MRAVLVRAVLVPAVLRAEAQRGEGPAAGAQAGRPAPTVSPAGTATRVASPTRTRRMARTVNPALRDTAGLARASRASRVGLAGPAELNQAAAEKQAARPAVRLARARGW